MVAPSKQPVSRKRFPSALVAQARTLYVVKGLGPKEVGEKLGLKRDQISQLAIRYGWGDERAKRLKRLENSLLARAEDEHNAFMVSMSSQAEELAEDSMGIARDSISRGIMATRELQQASQSAKNFVDIYFKVNRLDANSAGTQINVGSLYCNINADTMAAPRGESRSEKVVTEVSAEVKANDTSAPESGEVQLIKGGK